MSSTNQNETLFALVDCNSFFVSCERVFNPHLHKKPVVVLSSNDGCVVARSKEAKKIGIPMGAAAFEYKHLFEVHKVKAFSSNFTLYADMSHRVMETLALFTPEIQVYSIDEAFLSLEKGNAEEKALEIRKTILQWTGIPVSIGIGRTKTLAKVANLLAKEKECGIFMFSSAEEEAGILNKLPASDVWGIGASTAQFLKSQGIYTAGQFCKQEDGWIRKNLTVVGLRMAWELRGVSCLPIHEEPVPNKSIITSRTFGKKIFAYEDLAEAVASFTASAAGHLREQGSIAHFIEVFVMTSPFASNGFYSNRALMHFPEPSSFTPFLISQAKKCLNSIFRQGLEYKKAGIMLGGLVPASSYQMDLFASRGKDTKKHDRLMQTLDGLNNKLGYKAVRFAAEGISQPWSSNRQYLTNRFTSNWKELLTIQI